MRTTVTINDKLLADAIELTGITEKSALINAALQAFAQREAARKLARMGGTQPGLEHIPRRRPEAAE